MKLKYITFVFENCDCITIDGKYVGEFLVDDIQTCIQRIACNSIEKIDSVNTFVIEIHKDANIERYQHNQTGYEEWKQMTFDRFIASDITNIEFKLESDCDGYVGEDREYLLDWHNYWINWSEENDKFNEFQTNYISKDGHLYIVIAKDKFIESFFDLNMINDSEYMDFYWDMMAS